MERPSDPRPLEDPRADKNEKKLQATYASESEATRRARTSGWRMNAAYLRKMPFNGRRAGGE